VRDDLLNVLECPLCGGRLRDGAGARAREPISDAVLGCDCNAYPVVSGIPYMQTDSAGEAAMRQLGDGDARGALFTLLGIDEVRGAELLRALEDPAAASFRSSLGLLSDDAETPYLLYRFSDPTFLASDALIRALARGTRGVSGRLLDLCGGAGHLTGSLCALAGGRDVVIGDISFWKLWLAKTFVVPDAQPVCCDADAPLPFSAGDFSLAVCSDAFHYIWSKRGLASELSRLVVPDGVIALPHLHNSLCWNYSEGMPLSPDGYLRLFPGPGTRLFAERPILDAVLGASPLNLSVAPPAAELADQPELALVSSRSASVFRSYEPEPPARTGRLELNPLYEVSHERDSTVATLRFPSETYEAEFGAALERYLPRRVELTPEREEELVGRRVLLDLPERYL
jgi:SAM-dependent methyltransferase/uncharacterized protein YbaR (Trm112 family)